MVVVIFGVSGAGKTTIGELLAKSFTEILRRLTIFDPQVKHRQDGARRAATDEGFRQPFGLQEFA